MTDPLGRVTATAYTDGTTVAAVGGGFAPKGLPMTVTTAGGAVQKVEYFRTGDVAKITDPAGKVTTMTYDGLGRPTGKVETTSAFPSGLTTVMSYDKLGRMTTLTTPATTNRVTGAVHTQQITQQYDVDGLLTSQTMSDTTGGDAPRTTSWTYNTRGQRVTTTDPAGKVTSLAYDSSGRVIRQTDPNGSVGTTTYDLKGQLLTTVAVGYTGDPNNPSAPTDLVTSSRAYDPAGRLASETDAMGFQTLYAYTDNNLLATVTRKDPATGALFVQHESTFDAAGNIIASKTNNGATTTTYVVDAASRTTSSTLDPNGLKRTTTQTFSPDDYVVNTTQSDPTGVLSNVDVLNDPMGRPVATTINSATLAPVGRWPLRETSGLTAADAAGNSPATATGTVTWSSERGGSAVFNSSSALSTAGPVVDTTRSMTVSAWVKMPDNTASKAAVSQDGAYFRGSLWATSCRRTGGGS